MLVAGMIGHEIDHYFNIASVRFLDQLFEIINRQPQNAPLKEGGGYGKLSLREAAVTYGFSLESSLHVIQNKGFNANENSTLKESADALHVKPIELLELLKTPPIKETK